MSLPASLRRARALGLLLVALLASSARPVAADEGMWSLDRVPSAVLSGVQGEPQRWLDHVRQASVRFPGGSGAFVSPSLVVTNHHVARQWIHKVSSSSRDLLEQGFLARRPGEEVPVPGLQLQVLQGIEDVTATVRAAVRPGMSAAEEQRAIRGAISRLVAERKAQGGGASAEVKARFGGAAYHLYGYKSFSDVRLVFAPEAKVAYFGGDKDNFTYPRHDLDVTFFRVYEGGRPVAAEHYLPFSRRGVGSGQRVYTSGHPGSTSRLLTASQYEFLRDRQYPAALRRLDAQHEALVGYAARGPSQRRLVQAKLFSTENALKVLRSEHALLGDARLLEQKRAAEQALRARAAALPDPGARREVEGAWVEIERALGERRAFFDDYQVLEAGVRSSRVLEIARDLLRLGVERGKPAGARLDEYDGAAGAAVEGRLGASEPLARGLEEATLRGYLEELSAARGATDPVVRAALGGRSPAEAARAAIRGTALFRVRDRRALLAGGRGAVEASADPLLALARALDPGAREARTRLEHNDADVQRARAKVGRLTMSGEGAPADDADFTLRLSSGVVAGNYTKGRDAGGVGAGRRVSWRSTYPGMFDLAATGLPDYELPARWAGKRAALPKSTPLNVISTNDITGGNSGSPLIDERGDWVGIAFDGNEESFANKFQYGFGYGGAKERSLSVDKRGLRQALVQVYGATELVGELSAAARRPPRARWFGRPPAAARPPAPRALRPVARSWPSRGGRSAAPVGGRLARSPGRR